MLFAYAWVATYSNRKFFSSGTSFVINLILPTSLTVVMSAQFLFPAEAIACQKIEAVRGEKRDLLQLDISNLQNQTQDVSMVSVISKQ